MSLRTLVDSIRRQLLPFRHVEDIRRDEARWNMDDSDYLRDWLVSTLKGCAKRNKCARRGRCVYYEYSDNSRANYRICREFTILLENGSIVISPSKDRLE